MIGERGWPRCHLWGVSCDGDRTDAARGDAERSRNLLRAARGRQVERLLAEFGHSATGRVELFAHADLDCGALGTLRCDLALTPSGTPLSLLSVALVVQIGMRWRLELCAAVEVAECWFVDPVRGWGERYLHPDEGRYRTRELIYPGERVAPQPWPALAVTLLERSGPGG